MRSTDEKDEKMNANMFTQYEYSAHGHVAPDFKRRELMFDSFSKLRENSFDAIKSEAKKSDSSGGNKGTCVYAWGAGYHGQLGMNSSLRKKCVSTPQQIMFPTEPVVAVTSGGYHSALLTQSGQVWTWGEGSCGQLGNLDKDHKNNPEPRQIFFPSVKFIQVSCGLEHTAAIASNGTVYAWGNQENGALGIGRTGGLGKELEPKEVKFPGVHSNANDRFIAISCGDRHTAVIFQPYGRCSRLFTFGDGQHGQLGHGSDDKEVSPKEVMALSEVPHTL
jgi:alpha-tubulin suppressor-like RCC1 family protein